MPLIRQVLPPNRGIGNTCSHLLPRHATEEPYFKIIRELDKDIAIREYAAYVVAEVVVLGPADKAGNQAFPILAGYIFGKNKGDRKMAMTAPVTQAAVPVSQTEVAQGFRAQFVYPKDVDLSIAPEPLDAHQASGRPCETRGGVPPFRVLVGFQPQRSPGQVAGCIERGQADPRRAARVCALRPAHHAMVHAAQ